ncbi:hypothetical protein TBK1r_32980 [Stieleria magnilauensis]|uniref:Uncharacterized protein n=1 Tax=Stieleria magnilauensis TaxID=2527963 RepID=A0ABX5XQR9_9BACT|nr:hypothetical protein TBK1r_32980 [Planctomycetes bacterium TBK1r]
MPNEKRLDAVDDAMDRRHTAERCHNTARGREAHPGVVAQKERNPSGVQQARLRDRTAQAAAGIRRSAFCSTPLGLAAWTRNLSV